MAKNVLVVVDMQVDFVNGTLGSEEGKAIVPAVAEKVKKYRDNGDEVIFTMDTHGADYLETNEGKHLPVVHCRKNTAGWRIVPEIVVCEGDKIFEKNTFGSFELAEYLAEIGATSVEFVGRCTGICVVSNVLITKAKLPEIEIIVDQACCSCVSKVSHDFAIETMKLCHITVI